MVEYRKSGGTWSRHGTSTYKGYVATGLSVGTTYEFRVYAERDASSTYTAANSLVSTTVTATTKANNTVQKMLDNIRNGTAISADKKETCLLAAETLLNEGYEPAFVAGLLGNIVAEGNIGLFELYNTDQDYHLNLNGYLQEYYNTTYNDMFHNKHIYEMDLNKVYEIVTNLKNMNWRVSQDQASRWSGNKGIRIFTGVGCVGWSEGRLYTMIELYREVCNNRSTITEEEAKKAEALMIVRELTGDYASVYNDWKSTNASALDSQGAAIDAAAKICDDYEDPYIDEDDDPNTREVRLDLAPKIYLEMIS